MTSSNNSDSIRRITEVSSTEKTLKEAPDELTHLPVPSADSVSLNSAEVDKNGE